jgi:WD40 repeat protein
MITTGDFAEVWELSTGKILQILHRPQAKVTPSGEDGFWMTSEATGFPSWLGGDPYQLAFSPDSEHIAATFDGGLVIYQVRTGSPVRWLENKEHPQPNVGRGYPVHGAAFSRDGRWVCYGGGGGRINIATVEPERGERLGMITITGPDKAWSVRETEPQFAWKGHTGNVEVLAISPDSRMLATGGEDRLIRLWEIPNCRALAEWEAHDDTVTALAFSPDGNTLYSGAADGLLKLWNLDHIRGGLARLGLDWSSP